MATQEGLGRGGGDIKIQMLASENVNEKEKGNLCILLREKKNSNVS